jgi:shikimate kinase
MNKSNIALVGFMGTGKSTIGKLLAEKLQKKFVEMDALIVEKAGRSIPEIFSESEITFREYEMSICKDVSQQKNLVISTGGGVILNKLNIDYLKLSSEVVLLSASADEIFQRIMKEGKEKRPLLNKPNPKGEIDALLQFRKPFYEAATDIRIETDGKPINDIVEEIIVALK